MSGPAIDPVLLARDLLRCPSVTPAEGGALSLLESVLKSAGFTTERVTFQEPGTAPVENLYARIGTGAPHLMFAGHTDVVPAGDDTAWSQPPFAGEVVGDTLYGRGAVDMKGAIACAVAATLDHLAEGPLQGSISFLITGDEEGIAVNGTVKLLQWAAERGEKFDHCILGEPSNTDALGDMIKVGRRGSQNGTLVVTGKQGHVAYPERADNPVRGLVALMGALMYEPLDNGTPNFGPSNLEFTSIDIGNPVVNLIPAVARARFNVRFNDSYTQEVPARAARSPRAEHRAQPHPLAHRMGAVERRRIPRAVGTVRRSRGRRHRGRDRAHARALHVRRHIRRALHQELLPGAGIRPGRPHHASGRRAHAGRGPRAAYRGVSQDPGVVLRLSGPGDGRLTRPRAARTISSADFRDGLFRYVAGEALVDKKVQAAPTTIQSLSALKCEVGTVIVGRVAAAGARATGHTALDRAVLPRCRAMLPRRGTSGCG